MEVELAGLFLENSTFDYSGYENEEECQSDHDSRLPSVHLLIPILYTLALVLGLPGNGLVLAVLWQKRRSLSVTDTFILHLAVADTLLLLSLPFWAVEVVQGWIFGTELCKLTGALFTINFYSGIFLLACISLDRYLSVVHAMQMYTRRKPWVVQGSCLAVWLLSLLLSVPDWLYLQSEADSRRGDRVECSQWYPTTAWRLASRLLYHVVGFLLPAAVMLFCYSCILLRLRRGSQGREKQRATKVILVLVLAFFISWTPFNITLMVDTLHGAPGALRSGSGVCAGRRWPAEYAAAVLGRLQCAFRPALLLLFSPPLRHWVLRLVGCQRDDTRWGGAREESLWDFAEKTPSNPNLGPNITTEQSAFELSHATQHNTKHNTTTHNMV